VSKAKRLLDWQPEVSLDEGLRRTIEWFRGSLSSYKTSVYNV
jgi:nucleoside-diphosphate-sugar epimerase